ncbi:MAG: TolC family protein [Saprospiraceae bacterium]
MKNKIFLMLLIVLSNCQDALAQQVINASVHDIINTAQSESPNYLLAKTRENNSYWRYISAKSNFKPQLSLNATIPSLNRSISSITLPDGSQAFVNRSFMTNTIGLNLRQVVSKTGGSVFVATDLQRLDVFKTDNQVSNQSYLSTPISIGINQPIMRFNPYKWDKKSLELEYNASKKKYVEEKERLSFDAVNYFFDLYISNLSLLEAERNKKYLDSIAINSSGRFSMGRISETDLLQIQLSAKNADGRLASLALEVQNKSEKLRDFLGIENKVIFNFSKPNKLTIYTIDKTKALEYAYNNRSLTEEFRLRQLEAERNVDRSIKDNGPNLRLNGSFGLTQSGQNFIDAYSTFNDQERISLSIDIPIADFGRSKAEKEIAKSNLELTLLQLRQDRISFERSILVNIEQFELKKNQLQLADEALEIAKKRLEIAKKRFNIGKIDVTNLNIAISEEQAAQQKYYASLWNLWQAHYVIRNLTLYDFENDIPLE